MAVSPARPYVADRTMSHPFLIGGTRLHNPLTESVQGLVLQGIIALNDPSYAWQNWQGTLLVIAIILFSVSRS